MTLFTFCSMTQQKPHFRAVHAPREATTPKFELGQDFCTMHLLPKFHHPMFTRSEVIMLTNKQTNRRRCKRTTLFATLRHWVNSAAAQNEICTLGRCQSRSWWTGEHGELHHDTESSRNWTATLDATCQWVQRTTGRVGDIEEDLLHRQTDRHTYR